MTHRDVNKTTLETPLSLVVRPEPRDVNKLLKSYVPQSFNDARVAKELWDRYITRNACQEEKDQRKYESRSRAGCVALSVFTTLLILALVFVSITFMLSSANVTVSTIVGIVCFALGTAVVKFMIHEQDDDSHSNPYFLERKDKKKLRSIRCIDVSSFNELGDNHTFAMNKLHYVLERANETRNAIKTSRVSNAYDSYAEFLCTGRDSALDDSIDEYNTELEQRCALLNEEIDIAIHFIQESDA